MVELKAQTPCGDLLPLEIGDARLEEADPGRLTVLSELGQGAELAAALSEAHGLDWPKPGRSSGKEGNRCLWFGHREVLLAGPAPDGNLAEKGAVTDVSDGWTSVILSGAGAEDVLARLVSVDLRRSAFKMGHSTRSLLQHMPVSITRVGGDRFLLLAFRSMAATLVHDLKQAMEAVASRG